MCKKITPSAVNRIVFFTCDNPFKKGDPGYVEQTTGVTGDVIFTRDLWRAKVFESREEAKRHLENMKSRCKQELHTHTAVAMLLTPE